MNRPQTILSRRALLFAAGVSLLGGTALAQSVPTNGGELSPPDAHALAKAGRITLIDIRRPDEWKTTGSGEGAHRLDMRRGDFVPELMKLVNGDPATPVAVICARGHRSFRMSRTLKNAGFTNIIDVPEGMLGSKAGPGWIKRNLPLNRS